MHRIFLALGALHGALGVAAGAFGAHGLRGRLSPEDLAVFETGARYQLAHALALLLVAVAAPRATGPWRAAGWGFAVGALLFSGSLYGLALGAPRWTGLVTPAGGVLLLGGWALLLAAALRR